MVTIRLPKNTVIQQLAVFLTFWCNFG